MAEHMTQQVWRKALVEKYPNAVVINSGRHLWATNPGNTRSIDDIGAYSIIGEFGWVKDFEFDKAAVC
jgi:hypothetical protein